MKLRNKKTGESGELHYYPDKAYRFAVSAKDPTQTGIYKTLGELLQDWTDFTVHEQTEPLIKDEKMRKALRAAYDAAPHRDNVVYFDGRWTFRGDKFEVMFDDREIKIEGWTEGKAYHIEELCGEEKE